jgi:hypothetical protein
MNTIPRYANPYVFPGLIGGTETKSVYVINRELANEVIDIVCNLFGLTRVRLIGSTRQGEVLCPRMIAALVIRKKTTLSLKEMGDIFNRRDHTTMIHMIRRAEEYYEMNDADFMSDFRYYLDNAPPHLIIHLTKGSCFKRKPSRVSNPDGNIILTLGTKHKGERLSDIPRGYLQWMIREFNFTVHSMHIKEAIENVLSQKIAV